MKIKFYLCIIFAFWRKKKTNMNITKFLKHRIFIYEKSWKSKLNSKIGCILRIFVCQRDFVYLKFLISSSYLILRQVVYLFDIFFQKNVIQVKLTDTDSNSFKICNREKSLISTTKKLSYEKQPKSVHRIVLQAL